MQLILNIQSHKKKKKKKKQQQQKPPNKHRLSFFLFLHKHETLLCLKPNTPPHHRHLKTSSFLSVPFSISRISLQKQFPPSVFSFSIPAPPIISSWPLVFFRIVTITLGILTWLLSNHCSWDRVKESKEKKKKKNEKCPHLKTTN